MEKIAPYVRFYMIITKLPHNIARVTPIKHLKFEPFRPNHMDIITGQTKKLIENYSKIDI